MRHLPTTKSSRGVIFFVSLAFGIGFTLPVVAQNPASVASNASPFVLTLYHFFTNKTLSNFLAGVIFASLVYILILIKHPVHIYHSLFKPPSEAFSHMAARDPNGTYNQSFSQFKRKLQFTRGAFFTALLVFVIQILAFVIFSLIVLQVVSHDDGNAAPENFNSPTGPSAFNWVLPRVLASDTSLAGGSECLSGQVQTFPCGKCGHKTRACNESGFWKTWSGCEQEGVCQTGEARTTICGVKGSQTELCNNECQWDTGVCVEPRAGQTPPPRPYGFGDFVITSINGQTLKVGVDKLFDRALELPSGKLLSIEGRAPASDQVILILSAPVHMVRTARADQTGSWQATLPPDNLFPGKHQVWGYFIAPSYYSPTFLLAEINLTSAPPSLVPTSQNETEKPPFQLLVPITTQVKPGENMWDWLNKLRSQQGLVDIISLIIAPAFLLLNVLTLLLAYGWNKSREMVGLFLGGWRRVHIKGEAWGTVYNQRTKKPLPLARVFLQDSRTSRTIARVLTDQLGRYVFSVEPGKYRLQVAKWGYVFPEEREVNQEYDEQYSDLYHGEDIEIAQERDIVSFDVPMSLVSSQPSVAQVRRVFFWKKFWPMVCWIGVGYTVLAFILGTPIVLAVVLALQLILLFLGRALAALEPYERGVPLVEPVSYGLVVSGESQQKLPGSVVYAMDAVDRIFLESAVTDKHGQYALILGRGRYIVSAVHAGYGVLEQEVVVSGPAEFSWLEATLALSQTMGNK